MTVIYRRCPITVIRRRCPMTVIYRRCPMTVVGVAATVRVVQWLEAKGLKVVTTIIERSESQQMNFLNTAAPFYKTI